MNTPTAQTRQAQRHQDITAAAARALSAQPQLHTRGAWFFNGDTALPLYAAHLASEETIEGKASLSLLRARADAVAQRLLYCDETLHQTHSPVNPIERLIYELLEQIRCESLAQLDGVRHNLAQGFRDWSQHFSQSETAHTMLGLLILTISQSAYSRINATPLDDAIADTIESTRAGIAPLIGSHLAALRRHRANQSDFIPHSLAIARIISASISEEQQKHAQSSKKSPNIKAFTLPLNFTPPPASAFPIAESSLKSSQQTLGKYHIYTKQYDQEKHAASYVRAALLEEYRQQLDQTISDSKLNLARLSRIYRNLLATPQPSGWYFDQESGHLDPRRLSHLITRPSDGRIFKTIAQPPVADCQATLLIDCSGSMKGAVEQFAPFADLFSRLFEMAGAHSEILGFTTQTWNGGRPLRDWTRQGKPANPGRLNECLHLIFKPAHQNYKRAKKSIAALYKADLFREGIDGEALEWAIARLQSSPVRRRLLFVLSDGCPMDRATELANDGAQLLEHHLRQVITRHDGHDIEIYGLGLGLDLSLFYRHRLACETDNLLHQQTFLDIANLIHRRRGNT